MPTSVTVSLPAGGSPLPGSRVPSARQVPLGGGLVCPDRAARARIERRAGSLLRSMRDGESYRPLGFVRLGDYVSERLGMSLRGAQEMMRVDEALEALPLAAAAFEAGGITAGHVRILTRVATPSDEAYWVACARRMKVRDLAGAVAAARELDSSAYGDARGGAGAGTSGLRGLLGADGDSPPRVRHDIFAPAWVSDWWRETAVLVRRLAGSALPAGEAFGMVVGEVASGGVGARSFPGAVSAEGDVLEPSAFSGTAAVCAFHGCRRTGRLAGSGPSGQRK